MQVSWYSGTVRSDFGQFPAWRHYLWIFFGMRIFFAACLLTLISLWHDIFFSGLSRSAHTLAVCCLSFSKTLAKGIERDCASGPHTTGTLFRLHPLSLSARKKDVKQRLVVKKRLVVNILSQCVEQKHILVDSYTMIYISFSHDRVGSLDKTRNGAT